MMILKRPKANTIEEMAEKNNIKELLEFERFCRDNALWYEMHKCFAEDSTVNIHGITVRGMGLWKLPRISVAVHHTRYTIP